LNRLPSFVLQILPLAVRNVLNPDVRQAIVKTCRVFRKLCAKHIDSREEQQLLDDATEALCMLEKEFPPTFLDIMTHLMVHLVEELFICGPVHTRWMYPMERYMKTLKDFVRTHARPEGSMAEGYAMEETLGYCTEYLTRFEPTSKRVWDDKEDPIMNDEIVQGGGLQRTLGEDERVWAHEFVVNNSAHLESWKRCDF
jgi:hypothetical protein